MFAALKFRWVLVWICVIVFSSETQSTQGPAQFVTQPFIATAKLTHPQLKTKTDDYFLNPDDDSNNQDQGLQIRTSKTQKNRPSPAAKQTNRFLSPQGKKSSKPSTPIPPYKTDPAMDELAQQLAGGMKLNNLTPQASLSRRWGKIRSSLRRSKKYMNLGSYFSSGTKEEPIKRTSSKASDSENEDGHHSA